MRLFLDTRVLLAAADSGRGTSRFLISEAVAQGWVLISADYCEEEARRNLSKIGASAEATWSKIVPPDLNLTAARLALNKPLVFSKAKDRPVVISAFAARCEWLLTLDETDFHGNVGREIYGMGIATPGQFLIEQRRRGLL